MGRGYSYEVIRAKMLYRTYATRKPTYKRVSTGKTSSKPTFTISFSGGFDFDEMYGVKTVLDSGCGVDISELLAIVERAESFSNIEIADVLTK